MDPVKVMVSEEISTLLSMASQTPDLREEASDIITSLPWLFAFKGFPNLMVDLVAARQELNLHLQLLQFHSQYPIFLLTHTPCYPSAQMKTRAMSRLKKKILTESQGFTRQELTISTQNNQKLHLLKKLKSLPGHKKMITAIQEQTK